MRLRMRRGAWIILLTFLFPFLAAAQASAENQPIVNGVNVTVYDNYTPYNEYNNAPPIPPTTPIVGTFVQENINNNFDQSPLFNLYDDFVVKYEGYITAPCTCEIYFTAQADDGTQLYLDGELITYDWYDKGSGGSISQPIYFTEGVSKYIVLWFYENGGGAWVQLWWLNGEAWDIVPSSALTTTQFTPEPVQTTTTSSSTTTTTTTTTTIVIEPETTTTTSTTTTLPPRTTTTTITTIPETTTTTIEDTTTTTIPVVPVNPQPPIQIDDKQVDELLDNIENGKINFSDVINVIDNSNISDESVQVIVATLLGSDINNEIASQMASSFQILDSITEEQAQKIFETIEIDELNAEEEAALVSAMTDAPQEIKNTFEGEINVYSQGLDDYVPVGSNIDVGARRTLIAAGAAISSIGLAGGVPPSNGSTTPTGGSNNGGGGKKDDEEDEEGEVPEIEGPEGGDDNNFTKNSIFKYSEDLMKKRFSPIGFIKKFAKETAAMAFTISGTVIVFSTLSGETRKVTMLATMGAFLVHYIFVMSQNDE